MGIECLSKGMFQTLVDKVTPYWVKQGVSFVSSQLSAAGLIVRQIKMRSLRPRCRDSDTVCVWGGGIQFCKKYSY